jgi:hypothetical protein
VVKTGHQRTRRIRVHGKLRATINEDLVMQALLIIAQDLMQARHGRANELNNEP